jgi:hypothetical protein
MIILDTHIFVWMILKADKIPSKILSEIAIETALGIPAISLWGTQECLAPDRDGEQPSHSQQAKPTLPQLAARAGGRRDLPSARLWPEYPAGNAKALL